MMEAIFPLVTILAPLFGTLSIALFWREMGERVSRLGIGALWASALTSLVTLALVSYGDPIRLTLAGAPSGAWSYTILVDRLAAVMMVLISSVSLVIHVYSERYMVGDAGYTRFFALLGSLTFVLLSLVSSGNLLWMFACWHLVTWLLATLLVCNPASLAARDAGQKTFWVQSLGDAAFALVLLILYGSYGTLDVTELFPRVQAAPVTSWSGLALELNVPLVTTLLLVLSVMTKSAQFPFHFWLIGTIEAPTPVSALMHAGIVNAGGFLVNRMAPLFGLAPTTLHLLFVIGGLTALIGASAMLTQSSVKRTLVYSTMGQMGYMVMECGLGAFALAVFHLCAHGLFKATLFLNSGAQIHKARTEFKLPPGNRVEESRAFSPMTWTTGLAVTLVLPLIILLVAHGVVSIPLQESQGTVIFLFFGWVTTSQAMFSLYRLHAGASWNVSLTMLGALALIGLTYLWAGEAFTHFLYPAHGIAASYVQAAEWNRALFDAVVGVSAIMIVGAWGLIYGKAKGIKVLMPGWMESLRTRAYVAFLNGLYIEDMVRMIGRAGSRR
ncbi:MAG: NADH-quinone oxidoreductase subunit L [Nitrospira sp.]|nr:NADH-quinone oxidoreductase subunit L [Nitrospira sp.]MBX3340019.1 NADH-quinone oxidoreductase subunit L [Nitrospira sp.]MBX3369598.1 NADH-quinone oxidoreductase subunit L [Nitrospira sp.]MBX7039082.1 NADH-quinone oxidoreductase subunit L [Nitrospira sp.]MCW5793496.1 NADH-quinone oxidoreductase subunit L [Nitrospira sp.]